ncbi:MAG TPA: D-2-hydroxyacid dehydrogenase [Candidatus Acidoferrales bacterium]|nr:D-2-hydroxyacid dehydrogenase [Candidatus Acidoferrales bacterium]
MATPRVLEWVRHPDGIWNLPRETLAVVAARFPTLAFESPETREAFDAGLPDAEIVLGFGVRPANFASASRLRWIHVTAAGVEGALFPELAESPVLLTSSRGLHASAMAEHVVATMLAFARRLHTARDAQRERRWSQREQWRSEPGFASLAGSTVAIVGFGAIGRAIGAVCRALGLHVVAVRRHAGGDPAPAHECFGPGRLGDALGGCDWLVLCAPLTPETRGMIGAEQIARLKPGARVINVGRGALVDEPALVAALTGRRIAGAALDVMATEPLPPESALWSLPEVILTPHVAGLAPRYWERAMELFAANLTRWLAGEPLAGLVDKAAGY